MDIQKFILKVTKVVFASHPSVTIAVFICITAVALFYIHKKDMKKNEEARKIRRTRK